MNSYVEAFNELKVKPGRCTCNICKRLRYQRDLLSRVNPYLPAELQDELTKYVEWYFEGLANAEEDAAIYKMKLDEDNGRN